eukprot:NODE_213_length_14376_cov_0.499054.p5 type:complete len:302 gc:universal NODE_213_length_14376_cov_0.499054:2759-3664(+)
MVKITIPVANKSSKTKIKISSDNIEDGANIPTERHLILRLPESIADNVHQDINNKNYDDIKMEYLNDKQGIFVYQTIAYIFKTVDLPCILEAQKTLDRKQFYKSGDISQMILVDATPINNKNEPINIEEIRENLPKLERKEYIYPHGLTPPLYNARKRRFRKRTPKHEIETIEEQVKKLLERDEEADDVKYEIVQDEDDELSFENEQPSMLLQENAPSDDDSLVADIERELQQEHDDSDMEEIGEDMDDLNDEILLIKEQIKVKEQQIITAPNMIIKQKMQELLTRYQLDLAKKMEELGGT